MSEYGLFEADHVAQMEPARQIQAANTRFAAALDAVHRDHGQFLFAADGVDNFDDRLGAVRKDIVATVVKFVPVYPKVMREVIGSLKAEWRRQAQSAEDRRADADDAIYDEESRRADREHNSPREPGDERWSTAGRRQADINTEHDSDTKPPSKDRDRQTTINPKQRKKQQGDNPDPMGKSVETNTGDGSDSSGKNGRDIHHGDSGKVVKVRQKDERHTSSRYAEFDDEAGHTIGSDFAPGTYDRWDETPLRPEEHEHSSEHESRRKQSNERDLSREEAHSLLDSGHDPYGPSRMYGELHDGQITGIKSHQHVDRPDLNRIYLKENAGQGMIQRGSRYAEMQDERERPELIPQGDFHSYERHVDRGGPAKVQRDFGAGDDTGADREGSEEHHAAKLALDVYSDWAQSNGLRVASTATLEHYAATGVDDADYFTIAAAIRRAECECPDDDDDRDDEDHDDESGPPPFASDDDEGDDDREDSGDDDGDDSGDESDPDRDSDEDSGYEDDNDDYSGDDDGEESDTGDDNGDGDGNPFADDSDVPGPDDGPPGPDEDFGPSANDIPPADDGADSDGVPPGPDSGPPGSDDGSFGDDGSGYDGGPPDVNPDEFPQDDQQGNQPIDPVLIDQLLGLPPGTVEGLISDAVGGQPDDPAQALPGEQPAPWLTAAHLKKATRAQRNRAYLEAFERLGFNRLAGEDDGGGGDSPSDPSMGGSDQLLDTALQAVTQTVDQKTQEFQQMIDPLTQALQAIEYAQTVEQADNPLDVTPPQGTVDVNPSAAPAAQGAQEALQGAGGAPGGAPAPPQAAPAPAPDPRQQQAAYRVAKHHGLGQAAYNMMVTAMSRKHYEHVAEAIRGLPFEHRPGIAASMADMFKGDNGRFNPTQFYTSAGVTASRRRADTDAPSGSTAGEPGGDASMGGPDTGGGSSSAASDMNDPMMTASRRPFVIDSRTAGGGRPRTRAAANWTPETELNTFHFPNAKPAAPNDNIAVDNLPAIKAPKGKTARYDWATWERRASHDLEAKGVLDQFKTWSQGEQAKGLNTGAPADAVTKFQQIKGPSLGEGQITKLKNTVMPNPSASGGEKEGRRKQANWFMPKVAGWDWDDYQNGYLSKTARDFETPCCASTMPVPSHGNCKCGKLWNGYGIGDGHHVASGDAEQFIVREIPVRDGVIMAGRHIDKTACWPGCDEDEEHSRKYHKDKEASYRFAEEERDYDGEADYNKSIYDDGHDYAEDVQWEPDEDREDAEAPHAPGRVANGLTDGLGNMVDNLGTGIGHAMSDIGLGSSGSTSATDTTSFNPGSLSPNAHLTAPGTPANPNSNASGGQFNPGISLDTSTTMTKAPTAESMGMLPDKIGVNAGLNPFLPRTADWTKYDDDDPARKGGPKKPPSTDVKKLPNDWAKRDDKGNWQGPAIPKR